MEAIDYVKLFKLDQENYDFKREEFISELGKEFLDYCQTTTIGINPKTHKLYYYRFKEIIKNFESKFWAISKLKVGEGFTQNLWNAFFATQVVPLRAKMFPDIQQFIEGLHDIPLTRVLTQRILTMSAETLRYQIGRASCRERV